MTDANGLPLTRSLEGEVRASFAGAANPDGLTGEALCRALGDISAKNRPLSQAISEAGYRDPDGDGTAILDWVDATFALWSEQYPLATELQTILEKTRPLAAAFALTDPRFFIPGSHALHRLLDVIHQGFLGWHPGLGGNAAGMLDGVREVIERACSDFPSEPRVDEMLALLGQKIDGHHAQLQQLQGPLLERELTSLGDDAYRITVAGAMNNILAEHEVPGSVARFIKSDWYESGLRIAADQGLNSDAWRNFVDTTALLADAVQPVDRDDAAAQERLHTTMQQLPATLSKQLVSLQPDADAAAGAVGLIEYALLRNLRGEDLGLLSAEPIALEGVTESSSPTDAALAESGFQPGNWFALDTPEGEVRVRYVGALVQNHYLLFMDFLGARALRKTWSDVRGLLSSGELRLLSAPDSFCVAMSRATEQRSAARAAEEAQKAEQAAAEAAAAAKAEAELAETLRGNAEPNVYREPEPVVAPQPEPAAAQPEQQPEAAASPPAKTHFDDPNATPATEAPYESNTVVKLQIPMGTWMGFHDRDPPLMARVAVRDLEKDSYIFTNREGIKLRELTVPQLVALIDRDMVDILERKTNFRETVSQMRKDQDRLSAGTS